MTLRDQILARIDATPHRAPTMQDIIRRQFPSFLLPSSVAREVIAAELEAMLSAREIDTENGTDGLTYRRAKPAYVPEPLPIPEPLQTPAATINAWPKPAPKPSNCAGKQAEQMAATKAKFRRILTQPMTIRDYATAANSNIGAARVLVTSYVKKGFLAMSKGKPCLIRIAGADNGN